MTQIFFHWQDHMITFCLPCAFCVRGPAPDAGAIPRRWQVRVVRPAANVVHACQATVTVKVFYCISSLHSHDLISIFTGEEMEVHKASVLVPGHSGTKPGLEPTQSVSRTRT